MATIKAPRHWAARGSALTMEAPETAPQAGGAVAEPPSTCWEYDMVTTVKTVGSPPPSREGLVCHRGGCHCGDVRFEVDAPADLTAWDCNCSDCRMRRNVHFVVPKTALRLVEENGRGRGGAASLAEYRWGTGIARHLFCARCGICPFYAPRSNPDGWAVTLQCVDGGTIASVQVRQFDGLNWEKFYAGAGSAIKAFSKEKAAAEASDEAAEATADAAAEAPSASKVTRSALSQPSPAVLWAWSLAEVLSTVLLPFVLVLLLMYTGEKRIMLPGKPQP